MQQRDVKQMKYSICSEQFVDKIRLQLCNCIRIDV